MPITATYSGVYVEEIPSGVHTITGVATSFAVFIDTFARGSVYLMAGVLHDFVQERQRRSAAGVSPIRLGSATTRFNSGSISGVAAYVTLELSPFGKGLPVSLTQQPSLCPNSGDSC
jgi:phage tail sheath protein FI